MWRVLQRTKANNLEKESIPRCDWLNGNQWSSDGLEPHIACMQVYDTTSQMTDKPENWDWSPDNLRLPTIRPKSARPRSGT